MDGPLVALMWWPEKDKHWVHVLGEGKHSTHLILRKHHTNPINKHSSRCLTCTPQSIEVLRPWKDGSVPEGAGWGDSTGQCGTRWILDRERVSVRNWWSWMKTVAESRALGSVNSSALIRWWHEMSELGVLVTWDVGAAVPGEKLWEPLYSLACLT